MFERFTPEATRSPLREQVQFSATGGEYFRLWAVNLLLTLVTFGLYSPWAKVRTLRYFYQHTSVDGHALDFHGNPRRMFRGMAVVGAFLLAYHFASGFSVWAALVAAVAFCALWPSLYRAGQQFRLAHTSWRGLRFHFAGSPGNAYRSVGVPLALFLIPSALVTMLVELADDEVVGEGWGEAASGGFALILLLGFALLPYFLYRIKSYQHSSYALGGLQAEFRTTAGAFYKVFGAAFGLWLLLVLLVLVVWVGGLSASLERQSQGAWFVWPVLLGTLVLAVGYLMLIPYITVRMQNLVWSRTGNRYFRFKSDLSVRAYLGLSLKNWLLMLCTLGLYYPWAAVAVRRLRLQAVSLHTRVPLDQLMARKVGTGDAAGDAAADLAGLDFGV